MHGMEVEGLYLGRLWDFFLQHKSGNFSIKKSTRPAFSHRKPANHIKRRDFIQTFDQNRYIELDRFDINTIYGTITWFYSDKNLKNIGVIPSQLANELVALLGDIKGHNTIEICYKSLNNVDVFDSFVTPVNRRIEIAFKVRKALELAVSESLDHQQVNVNPNYFPPSHYANLKFLLEHFGKISLYWRSF